MPANANPLRVLNLQAAADIGQFAAVSSTGTLATAGSAPIGFTTSSGKSGNLVPVAVMGSAVAWAGAAITLGQRLEIGANGSVVPLVSGTQVGTALNAAASGDQVEVMLGVPAPVSGAWIPIPVPLGLRMTSLPFSLRRAGNGSISHDFDPTSMIVTPTITYYVDPVGGSDANSGLTTGLPLANLATALAKVDVDQIRIINLVADYIAIGTKSWNNTQPNRVISVINRTGYRFISTSCAGVPTWSVNGTYSNVYQSTVTAANAGAVSDLLSATAPSIPANGTMTAAQIANVAAVIAACPKGYRHLVKVASVAAVAAQAGTWYHDGATTLYVRANDDRSLIGDTKMLPMIASTTNGRWKPTSNNITLYAEGIDFIGGPNPFLTDAASTVTGQVLTFNACSFQGGGSVTGNGISVKSFSTVYLYRCTASGNWADGFNYHSNEADGTTPSTSPTWYELECLAYGNGLTGSVGTSDNNSTSHDFCNGLRVNSVHLLGDDATVIDINSAQTWNVGVYAGQAVTVGAGRQNFKASNSAVMLLDSCYAEPGSNERWLSESATSLLKYSGSGTVVNGASGLGVVRAYLG